MEQKQRFVSLAQSGHFTVTELCVEYGVTRKTGHKWLERDASAGMSGLEERSRGPRSVSSQTAADLERLIVNENRCSRLYRQHLTWDTWDMWGLSDL